MHAVMFCVPTNTSCMHGCKCCKFGSFECDLGAVMHMFGNSVTELPSSDIQEWCSIQGDLVLNTFRSCVHIQNNTMAKVIKAQVQAEIFREKK